MQDYSLKQDVVFLKAGSASDMGNNDLFNVLIIHLTLLNATSVDTNKE